MSTSIAAPRSKVGQHIMEEGIKLYRHLEEKMELSSEKAVLIKADGIFKSRYTGGIDSAHVAKVHEFVVEAFKRNGYENVSISDQKSLNGEKVVTYFQAVNPWASSVSFEKELIIAAIANAGLRRKEQ